MTIRLYILATLISFAAGCSPKPTVPDYDIRFLHTPPILIFPTYPDDCGMPGCSCWNEPNGIGDVWISCRVPVDTLTI